MRRFVIQSLILSPVLVAVVALLTPAARAEDSRLERARKIRDEILAKRARPVAPAVAPNPANVPARDTAGDLEPDPVEAARARLASIETELENNRMKGEGFAAPRDRLAMRSEELSAMAARLEERSRGRVEAVYRSAKLGPQVAGWGASAQDSARLSRYLAAIAGAEEKELAKIESERTVAVATLERTRREEAALVAERRGLEADRFEAQAALTRAIENSGNGGDLVAGAEPELDRDLPSDEDLPSEDEGFDESAAADEDMDEDADGAVDEDALSDDALSDELADNQSSAAEEAALERELESRGLDPREPELPLRPTRTSGSPAASDEAKQLLEEAKAKLAARALAQQNPAKPGALASRNATSPDAATASAEASGEFTWPETKKMPPEAAKPTSDAKPVAEAAKAAAPPAKPGAEPAAATTPATAAVTAPPSAPATNAKSPPASDAAARDAAPGAPAAVAGAAPAAPPVDAKQIARAEAPAAPTAKETAPAPSAKEAVASVPGDAAAPSDPAQAGASNEEAASDSSAQPAGEKKPKGFLSRIFGGSDRESDKFASSRGSLAPPVAGKVVASYGQQHKSGATYRGVVLRAGQKAPIRSVAEGKVSFVGEVPGMGKTVIVSHGNRYHTVYARLGSVDVKEGDKVGGGAGIGSLPDDDGDVHFELRDQGNAVDPMPWLRGGAPGAAR